MMPTFIVKGQIYHKIGSLHLFTDNIKFYKCNSSLKEMMNLMHSRNDGYHLQDTEKDQQKMAVNLATVQI